MTRDIPPCKDTTKTPRDSTQGCLSEDGAVLRRVGRILGVDSKIVKKRLIDTACLVRRGSPWSLGCPVQVAMKATPIERFACMAGWSPRKQPKPSAWEKRRRQMKT